MRRCHLEASVVVGSSSPEIILVDLILSCRSSEAIDAGLLRWVLYVEAEKAHGQCKMTSKLPLLESSAVKGHVEDVASQQVMIDGVKRKEYVSSPG